MERDIAFKETLTKLSKELPKVKYKNGDLSDIGNEVGFQLGSILKDMTENEIKEIEKVIDESIQDSIVKAENAMKPTKDRLFTGVFHEKA